MPTDAVLDRVVLKSINFSKIEDVQKLSNLIYISKKNKS